MSDNIPYDIQTEIIKSLPIKSLIRFRLVSKQWNSLITTSMFIAEYHTHQNHRHHLLVRFNGSYSISDDKYVSIVDDDTFPQHKFSLTFLTSFNILNRLVSSQGLLFVHGYDRYSGMSKALIWNPTIRKSVDIDVCCVLSPEYLTFGFGVCPDTCDPKIVKITNKPISNGWDTKFEVFTLSTNAWRRLSSNLPRKGISVTQSRGQEAIGRFMYWIGYETIHRVIVSFDMTSEEFTEVNLPDSLAVVSESSVSLSSIRESLIMVQIIEEVEKQVYSVWKMMEHGVLKSFTKLYTINTTYMIQNVHGFRKSGEPIVETKNNPQRDLCAYDPDSKHINYIVIPGSTRYFYSTVYSYIETLLLLDH